MGSMEPIEELFARWYAPLVRALAVAFADAEGAADAVQEAFIEANLHDARRRLRAELETEPHG